LGRGEAKGKAVAQHGAQTALLRPVENGIGCHVGAKLKAMPEWLLLLLQLS
jgi:hypothetical protein